MLTVFQAFDKQGFAAGTPPPFSLPLAAGTQAGPMGAPTNPYGTPAGPFVPMMPHSQILHPSLHQVSPHIWLKFYLFQFIIAIK